MSAILKAIDKAGGIAPLAKSLAVSYQAVQRWRNQDHVPAERVLAVERETGVPRHELRPDLYPREN